MLPHCGLFKNGDPLSVIICDNASSHHSEELTAMCLEAGVLLQYLPLYSPDLNPIETLFSVLKAWIKRYQDIAEIFIENSEYGEFLDHALRCQDGRGDPGKLFRKSGIFYRCQEKMDAAKAEANGVDDED